MEQNVVGVLTSDTPDVLSHAAVRARNSGVLLASCFQPPRLAALARMEGSFIKLSHSQVPAQTARKSGGPGKGDNRLGTGCFASNLGQERGFCPGTCQEKSLLSGFHSKGAFRHGFRRGNELLLGLIAGNG